MQTYDGCKLGIQRPINIGLNHAFPRAITGESYGALLGVAKNGSKSIEALIGLIGSRVNITIVITGYGKHRARVISVGIKKLAFIIFFFAVAIYYIDQVI